MNVGTIKQIIGPVVDVSFAGSDSTIPDILNALEITRPSGEKVILEVQQHLGEDSIRAVAMDSTDGLMRGMQVVDTGKNITCLLANKSKAAFSMSLVKPLTALDQ